jgi:hypothetical protein
MKWTNVNQSTGLNENGEEKSYVRDATEIRSELESAERVGEPSRAMRLACAPTLLPGRRLALSLPSLSVLIASQPQTVLRPYSELAYQGPINCDFFLATK